MLKTRVTEILGIKYPIVCGGMLWISDGAFAAAVSDAGGFGIITSANLATPERLQQEIRKAKGLTDKPFGINLSLFPSVKPIPNKEFVEVIVEEGVKAVETSGFRDPSEFAPRLREGNVKIIHKAASVRHCVKAAQTCADIVTIVGNDNGGAVGMEDVSSLILVPALCDAVKVPVIAGGGFADGRGLAAALALGAEAVLMGTRFIATKECPVHQKYKEMIVEATERDTTLIMKSINNTHRAIRTAFTDKILEMEARNSTFEELYPYIAGDNTRKFYESGDINVSPVMAGRSIGLIHDIPSVKDLMAGMVKQAEDIAGRFKSLGLTGE